MKTEKTRPDQQAADAESAEVKADEGARGRESAGGPAHSKKRECAPFREECWPEGYYPRRHD